MRGREREPQDASGWGQPLPDLGIGAVAILHRVLGLHQLLGLLNHLAPKSCDALLGVGKSRAGAGSGLCVAQLYPQPLLCLGLHFAEWGLHQSPAGE